jgi:hypothetical protein
MLTIKTFNCYNVSLIVHLTGLEDLQHLNLLIKYYNQQILK